MINLFIIFLSIYLTGFFFLVRWIFKRQKGEIGIFFKIFVLVVFGGSIALMIRLKTGEKRLEKEHQQYFDNFNVSFAGRVYDYRAYEFRKDLQPGGGPKFNLYFLEIIKSTVKNYDPSDTTTDFYCIIRDSMAMVIESTWHDSIFVGSILYFNGKVDTMYHYTTKLRDNQRHREILKSGQEIWSYKYDTVLYDKWRPEKIFNQPHRYFLYREYKDKWPKILRNP